MTARPNATLRQAAALYEQGRLGAADIICRRILKRTPEDAAAQHLLGLVVLQRGSTDEAISLISQAVAAQPQEARYRLNLGAVLSAAGRPEEALAVLERMVALRPDYPEAHNNLGTALVNLGRRQDALASYDRAIALRADYDEAFYNRGVALNSLDRNEEAVACYDRAIVLRPDYDVAYYNRGVALQALELHDAAVASYDQAIALRPDYPEALNNRGMALQAVERHAEALADFDQAIALRPDYAQAHFSRSTCFLQSGDLARGWPGYEWRWQTPNLAGSTRRFGQPLWLGAQPLVGRTILLHAEQGIGDTLQFCRFTAAVAARGARVVLEVPRPLARLLAGLAGVTQLVVRGDPLPAFDLQCPLMSLPLALGTTLGTIPAAGSYIMADPVDCAAWQQRLAMLPGIRAGLVWAGAPKMGADRRRSMTLDRFAPLAAVPGVSFVSLQKGEAAAQVLAAPSGLPVHDFTDDLHDFADTAALIAALDLVISVDTAVAHLAGAQGKPVWVLNRSDACWRWLRGREDSPWYSTARLFRQPTPGDWGSVVAGVGTALRRFIEAHPGRTSDDRNRTEVGHDDGSTAGAVS